MCRLTRWCLKRERPLDGLRNIVDVHRTRISHISAVHNGSQSQANGFEWQRVRCLADNRFGEEGDQVLWIC